MSVPRNRICDAPRSGRRRLSIAKHFTHTINTYPTHPHPTHTPVLPHTPQTANSRGFKVHDDPAMGVCGFGTDGVLGCGYGGDVPDVPSHSMCQAYLGVRGHRCVVVWGCPGALPSFLARLCFGFGRLRLILPLLSGTGGSSPSDGRTTRARRRVSLCYGVWTMWCYSYIIRGDGCNVL